MCLKRLRVARTVAIDLRSLQIGHENRGIGMVVKSVLAHLPSSDDHFIFYAYDSSNPIDELKIPLKISNYEIVYTKARKKSVDSPKDLIDIARTAYHRFLPLKPYQPDLFIQFDFALGIPRWRRTRTVCVGYDLIPLVMRSTYLPTVFTALNQPGGKKTKIKSAVRASYYNAKATKDYANYKAADRIVAISEATKKSFIELLGINEHKIVAAPLAPVVPNIDKKSAPKNLPAKPFIFYIGGTDSRKNVTDVIAAFNIARGKGAELALVLAGNEFKALETLPDIRARKAIMSSPYKNDIHFVGFISDEEKVYLYHHALAFVFCSSYEGFGLPVLEAQALGCPVISYNNSSIPEVSSKSVYLVGDRNTTAVANTIHTVSTADRTVIAKQGLHFTKKFKWDNFTKVLLED